MNGVIILGVVVGGLIAYEALARWSIYRAEKNMDSGAFWLQRAAREGEEE